MKRLLTSYRLFAIRIGWCLFLTTCMVLAVHLFICDFAKSIIKLGDFNAYWSNETPSLPKGIRISTRPNKYSLENVLINVTKAYFVAIPPKSESQLSEPIWCFKNGMLLQESIKLGKCVCQEEFYLGQDCGAPRKVWISRPSSLNDTSIPEVERKSGLLNFSWDTLLMRRQVARRLVHALPVNLEIDLFEARISTLYDVVDVFVIGESNMTNSGGSRPLLFYDMLSSGWLRPYHDKITYVFRGDPPPSGFEDGVKADAYMREHLTIHGLDLVEGLREDDLFMYSDGDELPRPELLLFLKLYDGWPQPVAFKYRWSIFGFFWTVDEAVLGSYSNPIPSVVSMGVLDEIYTNDSSLLRKGYYYKSQEDVEVQDRVRKYTKRTGIVLDQLPILDAGWHCSWCFKPEGIRAKLLDAPKSDYPRYGDDPAKSSVPYIKRLIKNGIYFNLVRLRKEGDLMDEAKDREYAPSFMVKRQKQYAYLLHNPYLNVSLDRNHR